MSGVAGRVQGAGHRAQGFGLRVYDVGIRVSTQGPSWGYSKVNVNIFFRKRWRFSPNVDKNVNERPPDTPTKGLLWRGLGVRDYACGDISQGSAHLMKAIECDLGLRRRVEGARCRW